MSYPIHYGIDKNSIQGKRYNDLMAGCAKAYSQRECVATENTRLKMSRDQPASQYNYTELGFKKIRTPERVFEVIRNFFETNKDKKHAEKWGRGYTYTNHWQSPTYMVSTEDSHLRGAGGSLKSKIWSEIQPIIEEWTGHSIRPTSLYGIRIYTDGAVLATHVDRLPLVSSCIINVAQDVDEPWPLEVYDHEGRAHNITMEPGDLVLYESHTVLHGRPFPMKGRMYANIFVHYEPVDHAEMNIKLRDRNAAVGVHMKEYHGDDDADTPPVQQLSAQEEERLAINFAAASNSLHDVMLFVERDINSVHTTDENGWQPIHEAVRKGNTQIVKYLVDHGADIGSLTSNGGSPLWWAKRLLPNGHSTISYLQNIGAPEEGEV